MKGLFLMMMAALCLFCVTAGANPGDPRFCVPGNNWVAQAENTGNYVGGAAGSGECPSDHIFQGMWPGATIKVTVEKRLYDENMLDYIVVETEEHEVSPI